MTATSFLKYKQGGRHEPNKQFNGSQAADSGQLLKLAGMVSGRIIITAECSPRPGSGLSGLYLYVRSKGSSVA
jgi:hypothetical protein